MLKVKPAVILRALSPLHRLYAARPNRRPGALGALLLAAALLSVGLAAVLLWPTGPAQAQPAVSSDATLSGLALLDWDGRELPLSSAFDPQTGEYGGAVPLLSRGWVRLRPTANHAGASITVAGKKVASGSRSESFFLEEFNKPKRIVVAVTAEDGQTRREYAGYGNLGPSRGTARSVHLPWKAASLRLQRQRSRLPRVGRAQRDGGEGHPHQPLRQGDHNGERPHGGEQPGQS